MNVEMKPVAAVVPQLLCDEPIGVADIFKLSLTPLLKTGRLVASARSAVPRASRRLVPGPGRLRTPPRLASQSSRTRSPNRMPRALAVTVAAVRLTAARAGQ